MKERSSIQPPPRSQVLSAVIWGALYGVLLAWGLLAAVFASGFWGFLFVSITLVGGRLVKVLLPILDPPTEISVETLVGRFPGVLELKPNRLRRAIIDLGLGLPIAVLVVTYLFSCASRWWNDWPLGAILSVAMGSAAIGAIVLRWVLFVEEREGLFLTPDGFSLRFGLGDYRRRWETVRDFSIGQETILLPGFSVLYEDIAAGVSDRQPHRKIALPASFDIPPAQFVELLNAWRERALPYRSVSGAVLSDDCRDHASKVVR